MSVSSSVRVAGPYTGNGVATVFAFTFKVFEASDLKVIRRVISTGVETELTLTTDYTVSLNVNQDTSPGGSVTLPSALASTYALSIVSDIPHTQTMQLTNQGGFYPEVLNTALDRAVIQTQQVLDTSNRSLRFPLSDDMTVSSGILPAKAQRASKVLTFDDTGSPIAGPDIGDVDSLAGNMSAIVTVACEIDTITTVASGIDTVTLVANNMPSVIGVNNNMSDIVTVANDIDSIVSVANSLDSVASGYVISSKTSAYTVISEDFRKIIHCSGGSYTVSLTAAATLGAGFYCDIVNTSDTSTHVIAIDPYGSETIDGMTTLALRRGDGLQIYCTGTAWEIANKKPMRGYSENLSSGSTRASASGSFSIAIGETASAIGNYSSAIGYVSTASGDASCAIGRSSSASGNRSVAIGYQPLASTTGKIALANGRIASDGDSQHGVYILRRSTTDATATVLTTDNSAPSSSNLITLPNNGAYAMRGIVVGKRPDGKAVMFDFTALATRGATAASTAMIVSPVGPVISRPHVSTELTDCTLSVTADTTNGGVALTVGGVAGTNMRWVATVHCTECVYS